MAAPKKITINPVSRLEGHGKVTIHLDDRGEVDETRFHITQFRGYERFCEGRPFEEMPVITQRICGICPISHHLAAAKACDAILGVTIPETARRLRMLIHMAQFIQSHALHFFYLASPDLLLGWDADPAERNVLGVNARFPEIVLKGVRLRQFGQEMIAALGGKRIHPAFAVPGGVINGLDPRERETLLKGFGEAYDTCQTALELVLGWMTENKVDLQTFANFESYYAGLVDENGCPDMYEGKLRIGAHSGETVAEFDPVGYLDHIGEQVEAWSYMKFPFFKPAGYPNGCYRVGPLGRLNVADGMSTPKADEAFKTFRNLAANGLKGSSLLYHLTRLIELLNCLERAEQILNDEAIVNGDIRYTADPVNAEGIGVIEAPRGTLIHHYEVDKHGAICRANLIVATGQNNLAMNRAVKEVAKTYIHDGIVKEGILNRVEGAIRCYDPCLSCATHALGRFQIVIAVFLADGTPLTRLSMD